MDLVKNTRILLSSSLFFFFGQVVNVHLGRLNSLKLNTHSLSLLDFLTLTHSINFQQKIFSILYFCIP
ncbi:Uncharacterised protein [Chlamydia trachomatis]|nr:Uncharacterised protein [Chlamydia trachomatis]